MATYNITNPQEEIDSYIDFCNEHPELAAPKVELPNGLLVFFSPTAILPQTALFLSYSPVSANGDYYSLQLVRGGASTVTTGTLTISGLDTEDKTIAGAINELAARTKVEAVDELPESPDANTLYVTPAGE